MDQGRRIYRHRNSGTLRDEEDDDDHDDDDAYVVRSSAERFARPPLYHPPPSPSGRNTNYHHHHQLEQDVPLYHRISNNNINNASSKSSSPSSPLSSAGMVSSTSSSSPQPRSPNRLASSSTTQLDAAAGSGRLFAAPHSSSRMVGPSLSSAFVPPMRSSMMPLPPSSAQTQTKSSPGRVAPPGRHRNVENLEPDDEMNDPIGPTAYHVTSTTMTVDDAESMPYDQRGDYDRQYRHPPQKKQPQQWQQQQQLRGNSSSNAAAAWSDHRSTKVTSRNNQNMALVPTSPMTPTTATTTASTTTTTTATPAMVASLSPPSLHRTRVANKTAIPPSMSSQQKQQQYHHHKQQQQQQQQQQQPFDEVWSTGDEEDPTDVQDDDTHDDDHDHDDDYTAEEDGQWSPRPSSTNNNTAASSSSRTAQATRYTMGSTAYDNDQGWNDNNNNNIKDEHPSRSSHSRRGAAASTPPHYISATSSSSSAPLAAGFALSSSTSAATSTTTTSSGMAPAKVETYNTGRYRLPSPAITAPRTNPLYHVETEQDEFVTHRSGGTSASYSPSSISDGFTSHDRYPYPVLVMDQYEEFGVRRYTDSSMISSTMASSPPLGIEDQLTNVQVLNTNAVVRSFTRDDRPFIERDGVAAVAVPATPERSKIENDYEEEDSIFNFDEDGRPKQIVTTISPRSVKSRRSSYPRLDEEDEEEEQEEGKPILKDESLLVNPYDGKSGSPRMNLQERSQLAWRRKYNVMMAASRHAAMSQRDYDDPNGADANYDSRNDVQSPAIAHGSDPVPPVKTVVTIPISTVSVSSKTPTGTVRTTTSPPSSMRSAMAGSNINNNSPRKTVATVSFGPAEHNQVQYYEPDDEEETLENTTLGGHSLNSYYTKSQESEIEDMFADIFMIGSPYGNNPGRRKFKYRPDIRYRLQQQLQQEEDLDQHHHSFRDPVGNLEDEEVTMDTYEEDTGTLESTLEDTLDETMEDVSSYEPSYTQTRRPPIVVEPSTPGSGTGSKMHPAQLRQLDDTSSLLLGDGEEKKVEEDHDPLRDVWEYMEGSITAVSSALGLDKQDSNQGKATTILSLSTSSSVPDLSFPSATFTPKDVDGKKNGGTSGLRGIIDFASDVLLGGSGSSSTDAIKVNCVETDMNKNKKSKNFRESSKTSKKSPVVVADVIAMEQNKNLPLIEDDSKPMDPALSIEKTLTSPAFKDRLATGISLDEDARLVDLAAQAARSMHMLNGCDFDECHEIDIAKDIKFTVVDLCMPLGLIFQENEVGCWVTKVLLEGSARKAGNIVSGDQLAAIDGVSAISMKVDDVATMIRAKKGDVELTFMRYVGPIRATRDPVEEEGYEVSPTSLTRKLSCRPTRPKEQHHAQGVLDENKAETTTTTAPAKSVSSTTLSSSRVGRDPPAAVPAVHMVNGTATTLRIPPVMTVLKQVVDTPGPTLNTTNKTAAAAVVAANISSNEKKRFRLFGRKKKDALQ